MWLNMLFFRKHLSNLFNLLLNFRRSRLDEKVFLVLYFVLELRNPFPKLIITQSLFRLELAKIGNQGCQNLGIDSV